MNHDSSKEILPIKTLVPVYRRRYFMHRRLAGGDAETWSARNTTLWQFAAQSGTEMAELGPHANMIDIAQG
jgi:hypothetical protein